MLFCINWVMNIYIYIHTYIYIYIYIFIHYLVLIFNHYIGEVQALEKQNEQRWRERIHNYKNLEGYFNGQLKNKSDDAFICGNNYTFYIEALLPSFLLGILCFYFSVFIQQSEFVFRLLQFERNYFLYLQIYSNLTWSPCKVMY